KRCTAPCCSEAESAEDKETRRQGERDPSTRGRPRGGFCLLVSRSPCLLVCEDGGPAVIFTLLWKEYREHRHVWVAMAAFAALLLYAMLQLLAPHGPGAGRDDANVAFVSALLVLAVTYGIVCGAIMLAGEQEGGTLGFLDTLPTLRRGLWAAKLLA